MVMLLVILAALAALVVGFLRNEPILLYVAVVLSFAGVFTLYGPALLKWLGKRSRGRTVATEPDSVDENSDLQRDGEGDVDVADDSPVYVVRGRKRFHQDSCRILAGRDSEMVLLEEAREEGFTPCTACFGEEEALSLSPLEHSN